MFALEVFSSKGKKVTFYTVRKEGSKLTETEMFFRKIYQNEHKKDLLKMTRLLSHNIANLYGAHEKYFNRHENNAVAFPPRSYRKFKKEKYLSFSYSPLRLYAMKISESIVILFNGGLKYSDGSAQDDSGVSMTFHEANHFSNKITEAISDGRICINFKSMVDFNGNKKIILY